MKFFCSRITSILMLLTIISLAAPALAQHGWTNPLLVDQPGQSGLSVVAPGRKTPGVWACVYVNAGVQVRRTTNNGATWSNPVVFQSGGSVLSPSIASDATGVMVAVWHSGSTLYVVRSTNEGATWGTPTALPGGLGVANYWPNISTNGSGTYIITHEVHQGGSDYDIAFYRSTDFGATWSADTYMNSSMSADGTFVDNGVTAAYGSGNIWVSIFSSTNTIGGTLSPSGRARVMFCRSTDNGATWSNMAPLNTTPQVAAGWPAYWAAVASDGAGNFVVTHNYHTIGANNVDYDIYAFRSADNGATWSAPVAVSPFPTTDVVDHRYPYVDTDKNGLWVCTYTSDDPLSGTVGTDFDILYSESRDNGASWTHAKAISGAMRTDIVIDTGYRSNMEIDEQRNWMVTYTRQTAVGSDDIMAALSAGDLVATSSSLAFGNLDVDAPAASTVVTYANEGLSTLTISSVGIVGTDASQFSLAAPADTSPMLPNAPSRNVTVRFDPSSVGAKSATLQFVSSDPSGNVNGALTGTGIDQEITVTGGPIAFQPRGTSNGPSAPQQVTITNDGTAPLNISSISITGANAADFDITSPATMPSSLAPGQSVVVEVVFDPDTGGTKTASLTVVSDDSNEGTVNVALSSAAVEGFNAAGDWQMYH